MLTMVLGGYGTAPLGTLSRGVPERIGFVVYKSGKDQPLGGPKQMVQQSHRPHLTLIFITFTEPGSDRLLGTELLPF